MKVSKVKPYEFSSENLKAGTKERFLVNLGELSSGSELNIPVTVVKGRHDGPRVYIGAGSHAEEAAAVEAVKRFASTINPDEISGTLVIVPVQNVPAWTFRSILFPLDAPTSGSVNIGGLRSGDPEGNMTGRLLSILTDNIATNIDFAIELRGTHLDSMNYPFTTLCYDTSEPEKRAKERKDICHKVGNELIRCNPAIPGGILWILDQRGAITTAVEAGEGWRNLEPFPSIIIRSIKNFCKATGSISGPIEMPQIQVEYTKLANIFTTRGGMTHMYVKPGQYVYKNDVLGEVTNLFDEVIEEVKSPFNGIVGRCTLLPIVATGGRFCNVAENNDGKKWETRKVPDLEKQIRFSGEPRVHN